MHWDREFDRPIALPRGRQLVTLRQAARYITRLPRSEQAAGHWRPAAVLLMLIGENGGCMLLARLAVQHGLRRGAQDPPPAGPRRRRARAHSIIRKE